MGSTGQVDRQTGPPDGDGPRALRVLVVEDCAETAEVLALLLRRDGHEVQIAPDGLAALATAHAQAPDVVLLDIGLPGMDGFEVARRLQGGPGEKPPLLVAITGLAREDDRRLSAEAGIDLHLLKPADPGALQHLLRRFQTIVAQ